MLHRTTYLTLAGALLATAIGSLLTFDLIKKPAEPETAIDSQG
jgi:hypothetical protein